ncbi:DUF3099 domain-containing protein [Microbacterium sp.]|uniref:DUF3099 domain-containing protein n=1 Tax=Microbacterium sp. TaxID=51671 RepID=UPI0037C97EBB
MKTHAESLSSTSLPRAPRDEAAARMRRYMWTMVIRITCFVLMAVVTPYGWYTWVFAAGAIFLPYVAVIVANVGYDSSARAEPVQRMLPAPVAPASSAAAPRSATPPGVILLTETPRSEDTR